MIGALLDHLWQSSLVALLAAALTFTVRRNAARVRFWLWFAASIKFLLPFAGLAALGGWLSRLYPHTLSAPLAIAPALRLSAPARLLPVGHDGVNLLPWLCAAWALGLVVVLGLGLARWRRLRVLLADTQPLASVPVEVRTSASLLEPGLVGIVRPIVVLPARLLEHLAPGEMASILAHEASHLMRRTMPTAAIHMLVEALFWFWPPVWLIGARMIAERERACDERVIADGHDPLVYARGILKVCRFCLQSPLACVAGVTGSDLRRRMERIMTAQATRDLDGARTLLLASAALMVVTLPVLGGFVTSPFAVEVTRRAAQLQQAVVAPLAAALAPQDNDFVAVVQATRRPRPHAASAAPPPAQPLAATLAENAPPPPRPDADRAPVQIVPAKPEASPVLQQVVLAIWPTGQGDPDAITCRVPQPLPGSRLPGPRVCKTNQVWAMLRARGEDITEDGRNTFLADRVQRQRLLAAQNCSGIAGGSSIANMLALPVNFCS